MHNNKKIALVLWLITTTPAVLLSQELSKRIPADICQGILCFNTRPVLGGEPPHVIGCDCVFGACNGTCSCSPGKACATGDSCPDHCMIGGDPNKPPTQKHLDFIANTVNQHQTIVTVFLKKACYDSGDGKLWMDEAARQGKAIRFVVLDDSKPDGTKMSDDELKQLNDTLGAQQALWLRQEDAVDAVK
jgi:hypothetical protein